MRRDRQIHTVRLASGVRLAYSRHGDPSSVPVLLLHAWDESLGCFDRLLPLLPATMHVLAMDQRGHGDSDKLAGGYALIPGASSSAPRTGPVGPAPTTSTCVFAMARYCAVDGPGF